jgi:hypothetical protein
MDKIYREGFCFLIPDTQRRIAGAIYRLCNDLAAPLGRDNLTYTEFCGLVSERYEEIPWSFVRQLARGLFPPNAGRDSDGVDLSAVDTEEKLEAFLLNAPEPSPEKLERYLKLMDSALPYLRKLFITHGKKLPHARGGAPKKLATPQEQEKIRKEIKRLREPGIKLGDIYARIALRFGVSASKIKQIWYKSPK